MGEKNETKGLVAGLAYQGGNITEAIKHIQQTSTAATREAVITLPSDPSGRVYVFNDGSQQYEAYETYVRKADTVSNIDSFIDLVVAEAKRRALQADSSAKAMAGSDVPDGEFMNVIFSDKGAVFTPDTRDRRDQFIYQRKLSVQWHALLAGLGKKMGHKDFLLWLQSIQPCIPDYAMVMMAFRTITVARKGKLVSDPLLVDGAKGGSYEFSLEVKAGVTTTASIPENFLVKVPYARGDAHTYEFEVRIDVDGGEGQEPTISAYAPAVPMIVDQAISDEMKDFDDRTHELPKLLCMVNY